MTAEAEQLPDPRLADLLRAEVVAFALALRGRRIVDTAVHIGRLAGKRVTLLDDPGHDAGLRGDLVTRALEGLDTEETPSAWITRGGQLVPCDADQAWLAALSEGFARHGQPLPAVHVLTRRGWFDLLSPQRQSWHRIRRRPTRGPESSHS